MDYKQHYLNLRRALGAMGFLLPIGLVLGSYLQCSCGSIQNSISAYYFTPFNPYFCGILFTIGFFLITYQAPEIMDQWLTNIAGIAAIFIAVFPMTLTGDDKCFCDKNVLTDIPHACYTSLASTNYPCWMGRAHIFSAGLFFLISAVISCFFFTRTHKNKSQENIQAEKIARNDIYKICGSGIFIVLAVLVLDMAGLYHLYDLTPRYLFIAECIMLLFFGISWLVKGETILSDGGEAFQKLPNKFQQHYKQRADTLTQALAQ